MLVLCGQPLQNHGARSPVSVFSQRVALARLDDGEALVHARGDVGADAEFLQLLGDRLGDDRRRQVGLRRAAASSRSGWASPTRRRPSPSGSSNLPSTLGRTSGRQL